MPYSKEIGKSPVYTYAEITKKYVINECDKIYLRLRRLKVPVKREYGDFASCKLTYQDLFEDFAENGE